MKKEVFIIYDQEKQQIGSYRPEELPIPKQVIIEKSIFFFDDPSPCFIHRGAVIVRLSEELKQYLEKQNELVFISSMPEEIRACFDFGTGAVWVGYCSNKQKRKEKV